MKNDSTPKEEANLECEICGRQQRSFNVVWDKDKNPHLLCGQCQRGKKVDSTPSEGWDLESLIAQEIGYISGIFMSQGDTKAKDIIMPTEELKEVADRINLYCLKEIAKARQEVEKLRVQLAGCAVAANGGTRDIAKVGDYGWSPSYQDVLDLRLKYDNLLEENK